MFEVSHLGQIPALRFGQSIQMSPSRKASILISVSQCFLSSQATLEKSQRTKQKCHQQKVKNEMQTILSQCTRKFKLCEIRTCLVQHKADLLAGSRDNQQVNKRVRCTFFQQVKEC